MLDLNICKLETFSPHQKTTFTVADPIEGNVPLELVDTRSRSNKQIESFSLLFSGPKSHPLPQKIHSFKHGVLGDFEIFIVPVVGPDTKNMYYEAVFSRLLNKS